MTVSTSGPTPTHQIRKINSGSDPDKEYFGPVGNGGPHFQNVLRVSQILNLTMEIHLASGKGSTGTKTPNGTWIGKYFALFVLFAPEN